MLPHEGHAIFPLQQAVQRGNRCDGLSGVWLRGYPLLASIREPRHAVVNRTHLHVKIDRSTCLPANMCEDAIVGGLQLFKQSM